MWKTASLGPPTAIFAAVLIIPLCVTTIIFLPGCSATSLSRASSTRTEASSYDSPPAGAYDDELSQA